MTENVSRPRTKLEAVLEFGDIFPRRERKPLVNIGPLWRIAAERRREQSKRDG